MTLKEELKMTGSFASIEQEAQLSLSRTFHVVDPMVCSVFSEAKISSAQYNVLRILNGNKGEEGGFRVQIS
jgi:hypothetical protein